MPSRIRILYDQCPVGQETTLVALTHDQEGIDELAAELAEARRMETEGLIKVTFRHESGRFKGANRTDWFRFERKR